MKKFEEMSLAQKRVAIAKDTLKWLKKGRIKPREGVVMEYAGIENDQGKDMRDCLKIQDKCEVCERGGLLYSYVMIVNNFLMPEAATSWSGRRFLNGTASSEGIEVSNKLEEVFDRKQLMLIEHAFENRFNERYLTDQEQESCYIFYNKYKTERGRFVAILNNIIDNKGEFKP